jgi:hypothetical protein
MPVNIPYQSDNMQEEQTWNEEEIRDLILFAQSLREENDEMKSRILVYEQMIKKREASLKHHLVSLNHAERYIKALEQRVQELQFPKINLN